MMNWSLNSARWRWNTREPTHRYLSHATFVLPRQRARGSSARRAPCLPIRPPFEVVVAFAVVARSAKGAAVANDSVSESVSVDMVVEEPVSVEMMVCVETVVAIITIVSLRLDFVSHSKERGNKLRCEIQKGVHPASHASGKATQPLDD
jgi:hypothetical protein